MSDTSVVPQEQSLDVCSGKDPEALAVRNLTNVQPTHQGLWHEAKGRASKRLKEKSREEKGVPMEGQ